MASSPTTRDRLIEEGRKALLRNGYEGMSIGPILQGSGVPKGSFYHFFASKEAFAVAVLEAYRDHYAGLREAILRDSSRPPLDRLDAYLRRLEAEHCEDAASASCLVGILAQTAPAGPSLLRERLAAQLAGWEDGLSALLGEAAEAGEMRPGLDPVEEAKALIDAYEGALIRMRATGDASAFARFRERSLAALRSTDGPAARG